MMPIFIHMWSELESYFSHRTAGRRVVECFLRHGFAVHDDGSVWAGPIEMAPAKIGRALGVDRRVVIDTAKQIAEHEKLLEVFSRLQPRAYVGEAARRLGYDTIVISADAHSSGVVSQVTAVLQKHKIMVRQLVADDPDLFPEPKLSAVVDGKLPSKALDELRKLPCAERITIQ